MTHDERVKYTEKELWADIETVRQAVMENLSDEVVNSFIFANETSDDSYLLETTIQLYERVDASIKADALKIEAES